MNNSLLGCRALRGSSFLYMFILFFYFRIKPADALADSGGWRGVERGWFRDGRGKGSFAGYPMICPNYENFVFVRRKIKNIYCFIDKE